VLSWRYEKLAVVTDFAEGDLFQILEDDRTLPLEQVIQFTNQIEGLCASEC
jgi:hypothetical protein